MAKALFSIRKWLMTTGKYTLVTEHYVRGHCNHRLRFGIGQAVIKQRKGLKLHAFKPHQIFGLIRWQRNEYGTILWTLYICEAAQKGRVTQIPGVYPGANLLFRARGSKAMRRCLQQLDRLEKRIGGDLGILPTAYWRKLASSNDRNIPLPELNQYVRHAHA